MLLAVAPTLEDVIVLSLIVEFILLSKSSQLIEPAPAKPLLPATPAATPTMRESASDPTVTLPALIVLPVIVDAKSLLSSVTEAAAPAAVPLEPATDIAAVTIVLPVLFSSVIVSVLFPPATSLSTTVASSTLAT